MDNATDNELWLCLDSIFTEINLRKLSIGSNEREYITGVTYPLLESVGFGILANRRHYLAQCRLENFIVEFYPYDSSDDDADDLQVAEYPVVVGADWSCAICLDDSQADVHYFPRLCHTFHETC